jgi:FkbM family methyltransferase
VSARSRLARVALRLMNAFMPSSKPTALDVFFAYRLLLNRPPDAPGFAHYFHRLRLSDYSLTELVGDLLASKEFEQRRQQFERIERRDWNEVPVDEVLVRLPRFELLVDRHDAFIGEQLRRAHTYEPAVTEALTRLLREGSAFVDVGANIGYFTLLGSRLVGPQGSVVSIEPAPPNFELLMKNVRLNAAGNVECFSLVASDRSGPAKVKAFERRNSGSFHVADEGFDCEAVRLDALLNGRKVDVIKIDVEGTEDRVLAGLQETLRRWRPVIIFEYAPQRADDSVLAELLPDYHLQQLEQLGRTGQGMSLPQVRRRLGETGSDHVDLIALPT